MGGRSESNLRLRERERERERERGGEKMFYLTTHSTHFIYCYVYGVGHMVKDHSDNKRGNPLPPQATLSD